MGNDISASAIAGTMKLRTAANRQFPAFDATVMMNLTAPFRYCDSRRQKFCAAGVPRALAVESQ
jgi:hypothetical protein